MKTNKNTRITLTVKQLGKLVNETLDPWPSGSLHFRAHNGLTEDMWPEFEEVAEKIQDSEPSARYIFLPKFGYKDYCTKGEMNFMETLKFLFDKGALDFHLRNTVEETVKSVYEEMNSKFGIEIYPKGRFANVDSEIVADTREIERKEKRRSSLDSLVNKLEKTVWDNGGGSGFLKLAMHDVGWNNDSIDNLKEDYMDFASGDFNLYGSIPLGSRISNGGYDKKELTAKAEQLARSYEKNIKKAVTEVDFDGEPVSIEMVNTRFPIFTKSDYSDDGDDSYSTVMLFRLEVGGEMLSENYRRKQTKLNENTKITLTIGQLKRLITESWDYDPRDYEDDDNTEPDWRNLSNEEIHELRLDWAKVVMEDVGRELDKLIPGAELVEDDDWENFGLFCDCISDLRQDGYPQDFFADILIKLPNVHEMTWVDKNGIFKDDVFSLGYANVLTEPKLAKINGNEPDGGEVKTLSGPVDEGECYAKCVKTLEDAGYDFEKLVSDIGNILKNAFLRHGDITKLD